jgi:hypothetical protein
VDSGRTRRRAGADLPVLPLISLLVKDENATAKVAFSLVQ